MKVLGFTILSTVARMALLLAGSASFAAPVAAQRVVPVHQEPRHHLVLDRDDLRVLDVQIPAGDTTLFHIHDAPIHYVAIDVSRTTAQELGGTWPDMGPRRTTAGLAVGAGFWNLGYADRPRTHRVANIGSGLFRLVAVVNRGAGAGFAPGGSTPGTREAESRWFERRRATISPGASLALPAAQNPILAVQVSAGHLRWGDERDGAMSEPGHWRLQESGVAVTIRNDGSSPVSVVLVSVAR